ncbi:putative Adaptive-response sensory-kinase SasA [Pillotina sp. SPG140]
MTLEQIRTIFVSAATEIDRLETVLDSLTAGLIVCDNDHHLILANKCAQIFLSLRQDYGKAQLWNLIKEEYLSEFFKQVLQAGDKVQDWECEVDNKGKHRLLSITILPLVQDHYVSGSLTHIEDITEKRSKEARARRIESLASLTTLAAGVAHEIKNPLGSISIHVQLIQKAINAHKSCYPAEHYTVLNKYLSVVDEEIDRLNRIVVDFLFAVRPMPMEFREGNINELMKELSLFVAFELEDAHVNCILDLTDPLPYITFDERSLKQALLNLIKNALEAMPNGGTLTIATRVLDADVLITVHDTGSGIAEDHLPKIFEPYFTTKETGSGLGLTLVYKIIREHNGEISIKSKHGEGTTFSILLPIPQKERKLLGFGNIYGAISVP